jgi:uncharacterized membrane protein
MTQQPDPFNLVLFLGRFHPLLVHLPIGFLTLLAIVELASRFHHFKGAAQARAIILMMTVASSIVTVTCGLLLASGGGYDPQLLFWHKWMGIALAIACMLTAVTFWGKRHRLYVGFLMITLLLLGPASHFGGSMTHGKDYLTEYAPRWVRSVLGEKPRIRAMRPTVTDPKQVVVFAGLVQPVFTDNCISCHNSDKSQGQLRLDSWEGIQKGGADGPTIAPGDPRASLLLARLQLPSDDAKHMPPAGKPQPTDDQIALLKWWIESGASPDKTLGALDPPPQVAAIACDQLGIAPPAPPPPPAPLADLQPAINHLTQSIGVIVAPVSGDAPWLSCNASLSRTFGDAQLAQLAPLARNITSLDLAGTHVTDAGMAVVGTMTNLERLRVERTAVTDVGLKPLLQLRKLDYLNLHSTSVSSAGLKTLEGISSLHHLYLWRTRVDPAAVKAFTDAMTDPLKIERIQRQIAALQAQLQSQQIEVVQGGALSSGAPQTQSASASSTVTSSATAPSAAAPLAVKDANP